jgi:hypothetical protein
MKLGKTYVASLPIGFDIGLPGLGLQASENSAVQVAFTYGLDIGLGVSRTDGVYIDTSAARELFVEVEATTPNMAIGGELAFLRVKIEDDDTDPTHLSGSFAIDLKDPVGSNNRLTFNELSGGLNFAQVVDVDLDLEAEANLDLTLGVMGSSDDVASAQFFETSFPQLKADFHLLWTFDALGGFQGNLQDVSFNNVRLDLGQFLSNIVSPIVDTINPILDPIRPILDVLNAPVPVISDITGDDVSFIEMASYLAPELVSPETADFIEAAGELVGFLDRLDTLGESTYIEFGSFNLNNLGGTQNLRTGGGVNFGGLDFNSRKTAPAQGLSEQLAAKAPGFKAAKEDIKGTAGSGFSFPLLDDPTLAFKLLLGQDVDIFRYDMPEFSVGFDIEQAFGPVYAPPPVYVTLEGGLRAGMRFGFGYDTHGPAHLCGVGTGGQRQSPAVVRWLLRGRHLQRQRPVERPARAVPGGPHRCRCARQRGDPVAGGRRRHLRPARTEPARHRQRRQDAFRRVPRPHPDGRALVHLRFPGRVRCLPRARGALWPGPGPGVYLRHLPVRDRTCDPGEFRGAM